MKKFAPFADGEISFPSVEGSEGMAEVHLFTGENGTGKTRVLAALMASLGNINPLQDRVRQDSGAELDVFGDCRWWSNHMGGDELVYRYFNGMQATQSLPDQVLSEYGAVVADGTEQWPSNIPLPSEGWAMAGAGIALTMDADVSQGTGVKAANASERLVLSGPVGGSAGAQRIKEFRVNVALERDGQNGTNNEGRLAYSLRRLEETISDITGHRFSLGLPLGKEKLMSVKWDDALLFLSELPDGLRSLLNWLAGWVVLQVEQFEGSARPLDEPVVLILDEPENHLHPEWQRRVLPAVQKLFPNAQMFVVTHSPFVVCSLNDGRIHKFTRGEDGLVRIEPPKAASRGDSYMTAVQEILDVTEWFDPETEKEIAEFETMLDAAYQHNGASVDAMRKKAEDLAKRSQEVTNLVANLIAQFDRTSAAQSKKQ